MSTDAWFCSDQLEAVLQSRAFPGNEYDQPDCGATTEADDGGNVYCTRAEGHDGRHMAGLRGRYPDRPEVTLYAVVAAWPGSQKPTAGISPL